MGVNIRKEIPSDIELINSLTAEAFQNAEHTDHTEQFIISNLRNSGALSISLVAETTTQIVGHVALSPVMISDYSKDWYGLGPISVSPTKQGKGIGSKLMREAIIELKNLNANGCVLLGDPNYYCRFGFKPIEGLILPDVPPKYFQAILIQGTYPKGVVTYHESFLVQN